MCCIEGGKASLPRTLRSEVLGTWLFEFCPSEFLLDVQRRPPEAPVRNGVLERVDNVKRGRGRPKLTWDESVKRDFKDWNISKEIALDRSVWRLAINVPEP